MNATGATDNGRSAKPCSRNARVFISALTGEPITAHICYRSCQWDSAAAGIFCLDIFKLYKMHGYNSFDWRTKISYPEDLITQFYNNVSTQIALGVLPASASVAIQWHAHSSYVNLEFTTSGDHWTRTDYLIERILRSGIDVLKYEGLVDCLFFSLLIFSQAHCSIRDMQFPGHPTPHVASTGLRSPRSFQRR